MGCSQSTPAVAESGAPTATMQDDHHVTFKQQQQQKEASSEAVVKPVVVVKPAAVIRDHLPAESRSVTTAATCAATTHSEEVSGTESDTSSPCVREEEHHQPPQHFNTPHQQSVSNASSAMTTSSQRIVSSDSDSDSDDSESETESSDYQPGAAAAEGGHRRSRSQVGLDDIASSRRDKGFIQNMVHIEIPEGKPVEDVYDGVHDGPVLGSGISGTVRLVTHKATGVKYACKVLDLELIDEVEQLQQLREEIQILSELDHPNIIRLEEVYEGESEIFLIQELCLGGELFDRLDEQPDYHYTEGECARLVKQMLSAIAYIHSRGIIHRDLKLENFLFQTTAADSELKMIDFGLSKHFRVGETLNDPVGTPYTVAPEVIKGCYDERVDIWSIGVITFLLLSGEPPFGGCGGPESLATVRNNILRGEYHFEPRDIWGDVSDAAKAFITSLLVTDNQMRPTASKAQKHRWMKHWANESSRIGSTHDHLLSPHVVTALLNFKEYSDMRKLLCEVLSFTLMPDQIKELRKEFEKMDTDGSGEITLEALRDVLWSAGSMGVLSETEVADIFNAMRVNKKNAPNSGGIHWHEFIAANLSQCKVDDRNLRLAFDRLDSDHKGFITLDDIIDLMGIDCNEREQEIRQMWIDSLQMVQSHSGRITYQDFLLLMSDPSRSQRLLLGATR